IVRGTIDCLARTGPDEVTVLEFKTGRPRRWHQEQLGIYQKAAQTLFPANQIVAESVYSGKREEARRATLVGLSTEKDGTSSISPGIPAKMCRNPTISALPRRGASPTIEKLGA